MFFTHCPRWVALLVFSGVAFPVAADGGTAELSGAPVLTLAATEKNCLLQNSAQTGSRSYQLLLGPRSRIPFELDVDVVVDEEAVELDFSYRLGDRIYRPLFGRGKAEWLAEAAFAAQEISGEAYFERLDEAELMEDSLDPAITEASVTVNGEDWADYVTKRRAAERFPALREASVSLAFEGVSVVLTEGGEAIRSLSISYAGPCKIVLEVE